MTINELRAKRNQLWEGAKAFLESHRQEDQTPHKREHENLRAPILTKDCAPSPMPI